MATTAPTCCASGAPRVEQVALPSRPRLALRDFALAMLGWTLAWIAAEPASAFLAYQVLGVSPAGRLGPAIAFFAYEAPKVLLLLVAVVFVIGILNSYFTAARARRILAGRREAVGNVLAALLGVVTPFCSCSTVPLFIGERGAKGAASVRKVVGKTWPYVLAGIGVGAFVHGWVPEGFLASFMGKSAWWSVPLAVAIGVPMYASTATLVPIVQALLAKGAALGTALAFMMAVVGLSLPEFILLRRVLKPRLLVTFIGVVSAGILAVGWLFNAVL
jgi:uncharacterized membrane protein YraQ (UPF0718 family)